MSARILIVDDTEMILKMVRAILVKDGYEVVTARNGVEALEVVKSTPPTTAKIPIIILTALTDATTLEMGEIRFETTAMPPN